MDATTYKVLGATIDSFVSGQLLPEPVLLSLLQNNWVEAFTLDPSTGAYRKVTVAFGPLQQLYFHATEGGVEDYKRATAAVFERHGRTPAGLIPDTTFSYLRSWGLTPFQRSPFSGASRDFHRVIERAFRPLQLLSAIWAFSLAALAAVSFIVAVSRLSLLALAVALVAAPLALIFWCLAQPGRGAE